MLWIETHLYFRGLILTAMFITMCFALCLTPSAWRRRGWVNKLLLCLCAAVSFGAIVCFGSGLKASYYTLSQSRFTIRCEAAPVWAVAAGLLSVNGYLAAFLARELRHRKNTITPDSVKESLDHLPTGLCFCDKDGSVMLANHRMYDLCQKIVGRDLQNAMLFWEILSKGTPQEGVTRLTEGERPTFRLSDGTVWSFKRQVEEGVVQLIGSDITHLRSLADDLAQKNLALAERNLRLQDYNDNVEQLAREKEQLDTKARIHSQFGQALLATRHFLRDEDAPDQDVMEIWEQTRQTLRDNVAVDEDAYSLESLKQTARAAGMTLELRGSIPSEGTVGSLFMEAAVEALTNAVRHAHAKHLYFEISQTEDTAVARFANDGRIPSAPITEGGGLSALRRKTELVGGTMTVETAPAFALVLTVPKERSDVL